MSLHKNIMQAIAVVVLGGGMLGAANAGEKRQAFRVVVPPRIEAAIISGQMQFRTTTPIAVKTETLPANPRTAASAKSRWISRTVTIRDAGRWSQPMNTDSRRTVVVTICPL